MTSTSVPMKNWTTTSPARARPSTHGRRRCVTRRSARTRTMRGGTARKAMFSWLSASSVTTNGEKP